jgi:hypothetical protein
MSKLRQAVPVTALLAIVVASGWVLAGAAAGQSAAAPAGGQAGAPVVIELFTSQGCSSCPPADRVLSELGHDGSAGPVIPLAYHVDYWDHLGWSDPFSSKRWSERQEGYAHTLGHDGVATPELVIDGRSDCVGSRRDEVLSKIAAARAQEPAARVDLSLGAPTGGGRHQKLPVKVSAQTLRQTGNADPEVWVALTQSGLSTAVKSGENASTTLRDDYVVRRLQKAFKLSKSAGAQRDGEVDLELDPSWPPAALTVVAFVQDPKSLAIVGGASSPVVKP